MVLLARRLPGEDHPFYGRLVPFSPRDEDEGCPAATDLGGLRNETDERLLEGFHNPEHEGPDVTLPVGVVLPQVPGEGVGPLKGFNWHWAVCFDEFFYEQKSFPEKR